MATAASAPARLAPNATETVSATEIPSKAAIADRVAALLVRPNEIRFKDFEDPSYSFVWAVQDYCNVFAPLTLVSAGLELEISMSLLKKTKELGVPGIAEYFCTKTIAWNVSMDREGLDAWKDVPVSTKAQLSWIFHERYFSDFDWRQMSIIDLVEQDAYLLDFLLRGEWPDESDKKACRHFIDILWTVATRAMRRMRILDHPELMEKEIERSMQP